ncbi:hypothetical protein C6P41_003807 [Kluyveromyces marxianus]|nr:hypothetical protein C6P41_003807 [Kluyveromyces marxianus]
MIKILLSLVFLLLAQLVHSNKDETPHIIVARDYSGLYYVNTTFGTPGQEQQLRVDMSQPYTWVVSGEIYPQCNKLNSGCLTGSLYYPLESTTSHEQDNGEYVRLQFLDLISINGTKYNDNMNFTNAVIESNGSTYEKNNTMWNEQDGWLSINKTSFIVANETGSLVQGSLGLAGPINDPASDPQSSLNFDESYYFLSHLKNDGVIESSSYSLWVNNDTDDDINQLLTNDNIGRLLLGAVDPKYYEGQLVSFQAIPFKDEQSGFLSYGYPIVPMSKISITNNNNEALNLTDSNFLQPVFLHSRYLYSYLPLSVIIQVAIQTNAVYVQSLDRWLVACEIGDLGSNIEFEFGNLTIGVPTVDFLGATNNIAMAQAAFPSDVEKASNSSAAKKIQSSTIPYAITNNVTHQLTMSNSLAKVSSDLLDKYTATIRSDGEIFTGRSFYDTSRTSTIESHTPTSTAQEQTSTKQNSKTGTSTAAASRTKPVLTTFSQKYDNPWLFPLAFALVGLFGLSLSL